MRMTASSPGRLLALLPIVAMVLAGCVGGETGWRPPESAQVWDVVWDVPVQRVAETMQQQGLDCTGLTLAELPPRNTRHAGICRLSGELVEVVTFGDREERFAFLSSRSEEGHIVAGSKWAIGIRDRRLAERVQRVLGGELHNGIIAIPT